MDSNGGDGKASSQHIEEHIVIVSGGIGRLACALALHRLINQFPEFHVNAEIKPRAIQLLATLFTAGYRDTPLKQIKTEALERSKAFKSRDIELCINHTPMEHFIKNSIRHRINTLDDPSSQVVGGVTLAGDASHPTTPNMGQGGCLALENAILLTRKLFPVLKEGESVFENIHLALLQFQRERHHQTYSLSVRSYNVGSIMQSPWSAICFYRDWFLISQGMNPKHFLSHTFFDVEELPVAAYSDSQKCTSVLNLEVW